MMNRRRPMPNLQFESMNGGKDFDKNIIIYAVPETCSFAEALCGISVNAGSSCSSA